VFELDARRGLDGTGSDGKEQESSRLTRISSLRCGIACGESDDSDYTSAKAWNLEDLLDPQAQPSARTGAATPRMKDWTSDG